MASNSKFFGRKYVLSILLPGEAEPVIFETPAHSAAMDIKFDVTYARGQTAREGTVSVLGLGREHINQITALSGMTRGKAMSKLVRLKLEAGYFTDAGTVEVINGFIWYATVTAPPNMWLTMKVSEYNPLGARKVQIEPENSPLPIRVAIEKVLALFSVREGCDFILQDKTENQLIDNGDIYVQFDFSANKGCLSLSEAIQEFNRQCSHEVQFILRTRGRDVSNKERYVEALDKDYDKVTPVDDAEIDGDNGLLSVTGIDAVNGCITTFIDGTIDDELSHMQLTSELNPQANGRYYILKKQYIGHFLGQEWYTRYFCSAREGDAKKAEENAQEDA